jgi:hypothetical protein
MHPLRLLLVFIREKLTIDLSPQLSGAETTNRKLYYYMCAGRASIPMSKSKFESVKSISWRTPEAGERSGDVGVQVSGQLLLAAGAGHHKRARAIIRCCARVVV